MTEQITLKEHCLGSTLDRYPCIVLVRLDGNGHKVAFYCWGGKEALLQDGDMLIHSIDGGKETWDYIKVRK